MNESNNSPIDTSNSGTTKTLFLEHSVKASPLTLSPLRSPIEANHDIHPRFTQPTVCQECQKCLSETTLDELKLPPSNFRYESTDWQATNGRGAKQSKELAIDQVPSGEPAVFRKVVPPNDNVHRSKLVLDKARLSRYWHRLSPYSFVALYHSVKSHLKRALFFF